MKPTLYLETTIPSYLTAWPSKVPLRAAHQAITKAWWEKRRHDFVLFSSRLVIEEASVGDAIAAAERTRLISTVVLLEITPEAEHLAKLLTGPGLLPGKASRDAVHVATAAVNGIHFLLTWNCRHLANEEILENVERICRQHGHACPVVCTPETLMGL